MEGGGNLVEQLRRKTIRLDERDNVVVACTDIEAETAVEEGIVTKEFIPAGYKIASGTIKKWRTDLEIQYCDRICGGRH